MTMTGKVFPVRACAFALSLANCSRSPVISPLRTECLDIFSPPPGDSEVTSQVERDSSIDTKIAPRALQTTLGAIAQLKRLAQNPRIASKRTSPRLDGRAP